MTPIEPILVIGASNIDVKGRSLYPPILGNSNPGEVYITPGGVGRNVASTLVTLGAVVRFITSFSTDEWGLTIRASLDKPDLDVVSIDKGYTGTYVGVLDDHGKTIVGVAGKNPIYEVSFEEIKSHIATEKAWVLDTNMNRDTLFALVDEAQSRGVYTVLVPASPHKFRSVVDIVEKVNMAVLNKEETSFLGDKKPKDILIGTTYSYVSIWHSGNVHTVHFEPISSYVDDTGAGDTFSAALIYHYLVMGMDIVESVKLSLDYAKMSLESYSSDI